MNGRRSMVWGWIRRRVKSYWSTKAKLWIPPPSIFTGTDVFNWSTTVVNKLVIVLNKRLTAAENVCSLRPHVSYTPFMGQKKSILHLLVLMLRHHWIELEWHSGLDCAIYIYIWEDGRFDYVSHLESMVMDTTLMISAKIQLLCVILDICFLFFHFASSARTRNLVVPPHWTLAMS
jgi:hypothetical protein